MKNLQTLCEEAVVSCKSFTEVAHTWNIQGFISKLAKLPERGIWSARLESRCINLRRIGSDKTYAPSTALYWKLTNGRETERSFWLEEMAGPFGLAWYEMLEISYAECGLDCAGRWYDRKLRASMLQVLAPCFRG